jgi:enterochelin esterase-like enzyme
MCSRARGSALLVLLAGCFAPERPPMTGRVERFELTSNAVHGTFQLFVRLPPGYDAQADRAYPLVVQLDANLPTFDEFDVTAGVASTLEKEGASPQVIVVGIGYPSAQEAGVTRFRDLALPIENPVFKKTWSASVRF